MKWTQIIFTQICFKNTPNNDGVEVDVRGVIYCKKNKIPAFPRRIDVTSLLVRVEHVFAL
jgi:hypothetical protein